MIKIFQMRLGFAYGDIPGKGSVNDYLCLPVLQE